VDLAQHKINDEKTDEKQDVFSDNQDDYSRGKNKALNASVAGCQEQAGGGDEQFVGRGVEEGAELGGLPVFTREKPVKAVAYGHKKKDYHSRVANQMANMLAQRRVVYLEHTTDKGGYQQYPEDCESIGPVQLHFLFTILYLIFFITRL
jgi:hypothetical protein